MVGRGRHRPARVLPLEPVDLPEAARGRAGLPGDGPGRLVSQRRDACPRAGRGTRTPLLAVRLAGRETRPRAMVPAHHAVRRRAPRLRRDQLAGSDPDHADELDRPVGGCRDRVHHRARRPPARWRRAAGVHDPPGHPVRGDIHGPRPRAPAGRQADGSGPAGGSGRVSGPGPPTDRDRAAVHRPREDRRADRRRRHQPGQRRAHPHLDRRLRAGRLRDRRDHGRARPRRARLRLRHAVRAGNPRGHPAGRRGGRLGAARRGLHQQGADRRHGQLRPVRRPPPSPTASGRSSRRSRSPARARPRSPTGSATG